MKADPPLFFFLFLVLGFWLATPLLHWFGLRPLRRAPAAGSSAPELFTSVAGAFFVEDVANDNAGPGTIVGSAREMTPGRANGGGRMQIPYAAATVAITHGMHTV